MEFAIFLSDALLGPNVPADRAKADVQLLKRETTDKLATKDDLQAVEMRLKHNLTLRVGAMLLAAMGMVVSLVKVL